MNNLTTFLFGEILLRNSGLTGRGNITEVVFHELPRNAYASMGFEGQKINQGD